MNSSNVESGWFHQFAITQTQSIMLDVDKSTNSQSALRQLFFFLPLHNNLVLSLKGTATTLSHSRSVFIGSRVDSSISLFTNIINTILSLCDYRYPMILSSRSTPSVRSMKLSRILFIEQTQTNKQNTEKQSPKIDQNTQSARIL